MIEIKEESAGGDHQPTIKNDSERLRSGEESLEEEKIIIKRETSFPPEKLEIKEVERGILAVRISPEQVLASLSKLVIPPPLLPPPPPTKLKVTEVAKVSSRRKTVSSSQPVKKERRSDTSDKKDEEGRRRRSKSGPAENRSKPKAPSTASPVTVRQLRPRGDTSTSNSEKKKVEKDKGRVNVDQSNGAKGINKGKMDPSRSSGFLMALGNEVIVKDEAEDMETDDDPVPQPPIPPFSNGQGQLRQQVAAIGMNGTSVIAGAGLMMQDQNGNAASLTDQNGLLVVPVPPPVLCSAGNTECRKNGLPAFPCRRCHLIFYCSAEHREQNVERHQPNCKTESSLEVMHGDEKYMYWHKFASGNLYDICLNFVLVWPSLTVQWLPDMTELENNRVRHKVLLGTQTNGEMNHLIIAAVDIPGSSNLDADNNEPPVRHIGTFSVLKRINHEGEIHRARYMPQNPNILATKSPNKDVFVFDCSMYQELPEDNLFKPLLRLRGHSKEGYGIAWNGNIEGRLLSGSSDHLVCVWDVNGKPETDAGGERFIHPLVKLDKHTDVVEDVAWHHESNNICATVGDDKKLILWDIRVDGRNNVVGLTENAHDGDINAVAFSCFSDYCLATGGSDRIVAIWDIRNLKYKLHKLEKHTNDVMQVQWSPHNSTLLASTGKDTGVLLWDIAALNNKSKAAQLANEEYLDEFCSEGPKELHYIHGGHVTGVNDISWNPHELGMMASISEDNILQVWQIAEKLRLKECTTDEDEDEGPLLSSQSGPEDI